MNVLFIGLEQIDDIDKRGLYTDFLREVKKNGHSLTILTANEKRNRATYKNIYTNNEIKYVHVKTGNITKNNRFFLKGICVILAGLEYKLKIKRVGCSYDLIICTTPCITFEKAYRYVKKKGNAKTVLLLKDLWPYDLLFDGILTRKGLKGLIYNYLEKISKRLFDSSDVIGCMTPRNKTFLEEVYNHGNELTRACIIPNSIEPLNFYPNLEEQKQIRLKYNIPIDKKVFIYGGNLGAAQGIDYILKAIPFAAEKNKNAFFLIIGSGPDYERVSISFENNDSIMCKKYIPRDEYERLVFACDVGLIFLNWNCHSPNSPSRVLQYLQASKPIICAVDETTDVGKIAVDNKFGLTCNSNDVVAFSRCVFEFINNEVLKEYGENGRRFLDCYLTARKTYDLVFKSIDN